MRLAFLSFVLVAVHVSVLVECTVRLRDAEQLLQHQQSSFRTHAETPAGTGRRYLELSGSVRKGIHRRSLVILPIRAETRNLVSIFDLRRRRFLCMDIKGALYNSRQKDSEDCLFQRIWIDLANRHGVFYSAHGNRLLKMEGAQLRVVRQEPPEPTSALLERFLGPLVKRRRRSEAVNPSDPLRSESHPSHPAKDHQDSDHGPPEQDRAASVSKETITSCDDPLRVLQSNGPVSPVKTNIADRAEQH